MTAIWGEVHLADGAVQHVRMTVRTVTVTPAQAYLGLGV